MPARAQECSYLNVFLTRSVMVTGSTLLFPEQACQMTDGVSLFSVPTQKVRFWLLKEHTSLQESMQGKLTTSNAMPPEHHWVIKWNLIQWNDFLQLKDLLRRRKQGL